MEKMTGSKEEQRGRKWKTLVLVMVVLASVLFISGCAQQGAIKSADEAGQAVTNVSTDIEDVADTLNDIDSRLGGTK